MLLRDKPPHPTAPLHFAEQCWVFAVSVPTSSDPELDCPSQLALLSLTW